MLKFLHEIKKDDKVKDARAISKTQCHIQKQEGYELIYYTLHL